VYKIILHRNAERFYGKADDDARKKVNKAISNISTSPYYGIHIKKLQGELSKMYRYRIGDIRILYEIHEDIKTVRIKVIEQRGKAYR